MRVGLLGDVHAEDRSLEAAADHLGPRVDAFWCVGDVIDGLGDEARALAILRDLDALVVRGNHERWMAEGPPRGSIPPHLRAWIATWPTQVSVDTPAGPVLLCHGVGDDDMSLVLPGQAAAEANAIVDAALRDDPHALVVCGHTHVRMVRSLRGAHHRRTLINAGTLYRKDRAGFAELDLAAREVRFYDLAEAGPVAGPVFALP